MYAIRRWSVRHSRLLETVYTILERVFVYLHPLLHRIGYQRLERPVVLVEHAVKGLLFDCRMCGQCVLNSTGMSCPMNCPKELRNGPCGGVRPNGYCEVKPDMPCVWVQAAAGSAHMRNGRLIEHVQPPLDRSLSGSSSWLRVVREKSSAETVAVEAPVR
jgi:hypothetical protein